MIKENSYHAQKMDECDEKIQELLGELPGYCASYINSKRDSLETRSRLAYLQDIKLFMIFLCQSNPNIKSFSDVTFDVLNRLEADDITEYTNWLSYYKIDDKVYKNSISAKKRKLSALSSLYTYLCRTKKVSSNPTLLIDRPKIKEKKKIIILEDAEQNPFLNVVETGDNMSKTEKMWHDITELRDVAIVYTLLGTGIRNSELVGIDLDDVRFDLHRINIIRKGGENDFVFMSEQVERAISRYIDEGRDYFEPNEDSKDALFLSRKHGRITTRAVQMLVKKYANAALGDKNEITPHKLRATFGTALYRDTGDIKLTADAMGHNSTDTTSKTYAKANTDKLRKVMSKRKF